MIGQVVRPINQAKIFGFNCLFTTYKITAFKQLREQSFHQKKTIRKSGERLKTKNTNQLQYDIDI